MVHRKEHMKTKSDPPAASTDDAEPGIRPNKSKVVILRPDDQDRLALAKARTGIDNETDVIRHALAKLCEQWEPTAKGGAK
jgi:hypothetical protein